MTNLSAGDRALLRFLQRNGTVSQDVADRVQEIGRDDASGLVELLEKEAIVREQDLAKLLAGALKLRVVELATFNFDPAVTRLVKETTATKHGVIPLRTDDNTIDVAIVNPLDLDALKAVEFATNKRAVPVVATRMEMQEALNHVYKLQESLDQFLQTVPTAEGLTLNELQDDKSDLRTIAHDADLPPVVKLADLILVEGVKNSASDVHVEPTGDGVLVRYRVDGILEEGFRFPKWVQNPLVARFKVMSRLDITERRVPQDGRMQVRYQDRQIDFRVSTLPMHNGEKITLRILDAAKAVRALDQLGFSPQDLARIRDAAGRPQGMILVTGPTGSGKTTTLYGLIRDIYSPTTNIVTIENPVEYQLKGINQVDINERQGLTFAGVLRSVLRQDPDVILVGEIRDDETARIAFQAAQTGHLVLSTLHTNDAAATITRLLDLGIEPYVIGSTLNLVMAQRLARRVCPSCSAPTVPSEEAVRLLGIDPGLSGYRQGTGCPACHQTGYTGRLGIYEVVPLVSSIARLIEAREPESAIRRQARAEGFTTLLGDALSKMMAGSTSPEELLRVVQVSMDSFRCKGCKRDITVEVSACPHCGTAVPDAADAVAAAAAEPVAVAAAPTPVPVPAPVAEPIAEPPPPRVKGPRTFKVLVVDDNASIRHLVRTVLETSGLDLTIISAQDGREALSLAEIESPDLVLLDVSMPDLDGFEVCRRLRQATKTAAMPVMMLTALGGEEHVEQGLGSGADDYIQKPFRRNELIARVRRVLERTYGKESVRAPEPRPAAPTTATRPTP